MLGDLLPHYDQTLTAQASFNEGIEESIVSVLMKGSDESGMNRDLSFHITSLPQNGILVEPDSQKIIQVGEVLNQTDSFPYEGVIVHYKGNKNFFTSPHKVENVLPMSNNYESFQYATMIPPKEGEELFDTSIPVMNNIEQKF